MVLHFFKKSYDRVKEALSKTRRSFGARLSSLFQRGLDPETLEELEEIFYQADLGVATTLELIKSLEKTKGKEPKELLSLVKEELLKKLSSFETKDVSLEKPLVLLIVGVNGNGKTTTIAKLAKFYKEMGKEVLVAAADTFRAAAVDQLERWTQTINTPLIKGASGQDPAAVCFDAGQAALARKADILLIDTAGRLQTKTDLMRELEKIKRTLNKVIPGAPHETLLVLDATTGQNGIDQAKTFQTWVPLTGIILTKIDGTAKGGVVLPIQRELKIPVRYLGTGETLDDLIPFDPESFINALFDL